MSDVVSADEAYHLGVADGLERAANAMRKRAEFIRERAAATRQSGNLEATQWKLREAQNLSELANRLSPKRKPRGPAGERTPEG